MTNICLAGYLSKMHAYCSRVAALLHIAKVAGCLSTEPYFSDGEDYAEIVALPQDLGLIGVDSVERAVILCKSSIRQHIIYSDFHEAAQFFFSDFDMAAFTDKLRCSLTQQDSSNINPPLVSFPMSFAQLFSLY